MAKITLQRSALWDVTRPQLKYMGALMENLGNHTTKKKLYYIESTINRLPNAVDELTKNEAAQVISRAKEQWERIKPRFSREDDEDIYGDGDGFDSYDPWVFIVE